MRVARRIDREEDGAAAVIVAISLFALVGIAALAVDAGQLWLNRRSLVIDTDAAALAAAGFAREQVVSSGLCDVAGTADIAALVILENEATTSFDKTDPAQFDLDCTAGSKYGHVTVSATNETQYAFASIFGSGDSSDVYARSHAEFGPVVATDQLRPLPLCVEAGQVPPRTAYSAWKSWRAGGPIPAGTTLPLGGPQPVWIVPVEQSFFETVCNTAGWSTNGQFLWIDFDGSGGATPCPGESGGGADEIKGRFNSPYPCTVYTHQYSAGHNCRPDSGSWSGDNCPSDSGNVTSIIHCVRGNAGAGCYDQRCPVGTPAAECPHKWTLLVYDELTAIRPSTGQVCSPSDSWANSCRIEFHPVGLVRAVLRVAEQGGPGLPNYFGIEFIADATEQGVIGGPGTDATDLNITAVRLCGAEEADNCKG